MLGKHSALRAYFAVLDKPPVEVTVTDVLAFIAQQHQPGMIGMSLSSANGAVRLRPAGSRPRDALTALLLEKPRSY